MKVIMLQDLRGKGKKGQLVEVSDGYARNFLFPKKLAEVATADNVNTMRMNDKAQAERQAREKAEAIALRDRLKTTKVVVTAKGGGAGRLFGAVTSAEIAEALSAQIGLPVDKRKIVQDEPIKTIGTYSLKLKLGYEISADVTIEVVEA
ncbi:MAG: 50S ribosomal protein L9 [Oscillospiraceae bacterium]|nr:50S ribosomal protein L9 [Oscillospiraceae bacterium]